MMYKKVYDECIKELLNTFKLYNINGTEEDARSMIIEAYRSEDATAERLGNNSDMISLFIPYEEENSFSIFVRNQKTADIKAKEYVVYEDCTLIVNYEDYDYDFIRLNESSQRIDLPNIV